MEIIGNFDGTSFEIEGSYPQFLSEYVEDNEINNMSNLLLFEERYIEECVYFPHIVDKFQRKIFNDNLYLYTESKLKKIEDFSNEVKLYNQVINMNNINGLKRQELSISIKHFHYYEQTDRVKMIELIYTLFFLASSTEYDNNIFKFKIVLEDKEFSMNINFEENTCFNLIDTYLWIIESNDNVNTRLRIIRDLIIRKQSFVLSDKDLESAKSVFNRVIHEEVDKYFLHLNMLKDDFIKLSDRKREIYRSLHLKLLAWGSSIALYVYEELKSTESTDIVNKILFSNSEKSILFISIFSVSIFFIWTLFKKEIDQSIKEYNSLKMFYTEKLFFDVEDFNHYLTCPEILDDYQNCYRLIKIIIFARFIFCFI